MSTVHEVIIQMFTLRLYFFPTKETLLSIFFQTVVAHHCGIKVLGISFVSNKCIADYECAEEPDHDHVVAVGSLREPVLTELVRRIIARINTN